ncbi:peptide/nickel transport system ATP-binding protein [Cytobacillus firmus]|uniref:Peptide/nickel transport system ATP-binding protein n=2 Tax=Cytobacillus TaxID=2675230 RepID=A0A366JFY7_CYTFI|nr:MULTISPECIES: ABC transporter ATP-binding protein [Cytobacillus]RBP85896.1 peptide/nickel transport system ATP-binding protein [Cytobacillus firmus]TDX35106.1 peptide/nickel transport system ATP-binding protein [Cytobacillus oceanisediminis]
MSNKILEVKNLVTGYQGKDGFMKPVDGVSFDIEKGETICIVGESGSGKSVTSMSIMRLVEFENGRILDGQILFCGEELSKKSNEEMRQIRGSKISMIFQEPLTALNPVFTIGKQITEAILFHRSMGKKEAWLRAEELVRLVGISDPKQRLKQYPHELSGGMRQRAMIAIALASEPDLLIADEPTTALDVTIEAQILELLRSLREERGMSIMLITHDIGVAAEMANRIIIMYAGKVMEVAETKDLFDQPLHPYSKGLLESVPRMDGERGVPLKSISGSIPRLNEVPPGCRFSPRCPFVTDKCHKQEPALEKRGTRQVACWHVDELFEKDLLAIKTEGGVPIES